MVSRAFSKYGLFFLMLLNAGIWPQFWLSDVFAESKRQYKFKLRWQSVPGVTKYKIQIGRERNFSTIVQEGETTEPNWTWEFGSDDLNSKGRVFYRVASLDQDGKVGEFSVPEILTLPSFDQASEDAAEKVEAPIQEEEESSFTWRWSGSLNAGLGSFDQKSNASDLKEVSAVSPYFQNKLALFVDVFQSTRVQSPERRWSLQFQFQYQPFYGLSYPGPYKQANVSNYMLRMELLHWPRGNSPWHFAYGLILDRSFRWLKTGALSVDAEGAFSLGPAAYIIWLAPRPRGFIPAEVGLLVGAPLTGVLTGGQFGVDLALWTEWEFLHFSNSAIGFRLEGDWMFAGWPTPLSTTMTSWATWSALIFHLGKGK